MELSGGSTENCTTERSTCTRLEQMRRRERGRRRRRVALRCAQGEGEWALRLGDQAKSTAKIVCATLLIDRER